ncbi:ferritin-like domain-containing protein [uncultured Oscillibacter sp.]|uniref:ferritin-like domain-containing protein n=1 Tax=uncultured Oscillibacter sp. TaxID=876091 RepID=UPI00260D2158|nr:ferritin-like domain-containing protein [uncultured Oscillibacter sp.]
MEHTTQTPEVYDFRQYDRIWQRVAPNLEPYPGMSVQQTAVRSEVSAVPAAPAADRLPPAPERPAVPVPAIPEGQLPGAERNPCCMGTEAAELLDVISGYIEAALSDRRYLLALARQAPSWARKDLRDMAADLQEQARRLMAAHYLITGQCHRPSVSTERVYVGRWRPALRERYHAAACSGLNYARSAEDSLDPCLTKLFEELSKQSYAHAETLMGLLQRSLQGM